jgi:hypothetical protein
MMGISQTRGMLFAAPLAVEFAVEKAEMRSTRGMRASPLGH